LSAMRSTIGMTVRQTTHHGAQNNTITGIGDSKTSASNAASETLTASPLKIPVRFKGL